jgi:hypothetical protein
VTLTCKDAHGLESAAVTLSAQIQLFASTAVARVLALMVLVAGMLSALQSTNSKSKSDLVQFNRSVI